MAVHIGEEIYELVKKKGFKAKAVADFVNISESTLFKIYKKQSVDVDKLIKFSQLLNTNLFLHYLNEEPLKSMFGRQVQELQHHILELETELNAKNESLRHLMDMVDTQKKLIAFQEEKNAEILAKGKSKK